MAIHDRDNPPTAVSFASPFASPSFYAAHDAPANRRPPAPAPASVDPRTNGGAGPSAAAGLANERSGGEAGAESLGARTDKHSGAPISEVGQRAAEARGANRDGKGGVKCAGCLASFSRASPAIACDVCGRNHCFHCASESIVLGTGGSSKNGGKVCDDCYFTLRDQGDERLLQDAAGTRGGGAARKGLMEGLPEHWRAQLAPLVALTWRTCVPRSLETARGLCTIAACGHYGLEQLCAVALALSFATMTKVPLTEAILAPLDQMLCRILDAPLRAQRGGGGGGEGGAGGGRRRAGSGDARAVAWEAGVWLQRGGVALLCGGFYLALLWQAAWRLWWLLGVPASMCEDAMVYLRVALLGLLPELALDLVSFWMLAQGYEAPVTGGAVVGLLAHVLLTLVLVFAWDLGLTGAALAGVVSRAVQLGAVVSHIYLHSLHASSWGGWAIEACLPQPLLALGMAAAPLVCAGSNMAVVAQVPLLLAATLGPQPLGAFVSIDCLSRIFVQVPTALASASVFKISSHLRSGNGRGAKGSAWLCVFLSLASGLVCSLAIVSLSGTLLLVFSHDGELMEEVASLLPLMALWQVWSGFASACHAVLEAAGQQKYSLWLKVTSSALVTIPVSCVMIYLAEVGLLGLLWSMIVGQAVGALQAFLRLKALDWASLAARFRAKTLRLLRSSARMAAGGMGDAAPVANGLGLACGGAGDVADDIWGQRYGDIAPEGYLNEEEAMQEVWQARFSVIDDLDVEQAGESGACGGAVPLLPLQSSAGGNAIGHRGGVGTPSKGLDGLGREGASRGAGRGGRLPGMEANAKCDASEKGDGGSGRGAEAVVEKSLLSGGGVTVRSVQLHMLRCDMQRSRALVAAVLPKAVGTWFVGAMEELEREQPSDEALLSAGGAPAGGGRHGFPAMEDDLDEFEFDAEGGAEGTSEAADGQLHADRDRLSKAALRSSEISPLGLQVGGLGVAAGGGVGRVATPDSPGGLGAWGVAASLRQGPSSPPWLPESQGDLGETGTWAGAGAGAGADGDDVGVGGQRPRWDSHVAHSLGCGAEGAVGAATTARSRATALGRGWMSEERGTEGVLQEADRAAGREGASNAALEATAENETPLSLAGGGGQGASAASLVGAPAAHAPAALPPLSADFLGPPPARDASKNAPLITFGGLEGEAGPRDEPVAVHVASEMAAANVASTMAALGNGGRGEAGAGVFSEASVGAVGGSDSILKAAETLDTELLLPAAAASRTEGGGGKGLGGVASQLHALSTSVTRKVSGAIEIIDEYADTLEEKLLGGEASEPASQDGS